MARINQLTVKMSIVIVVLLFACSCGNQANQTAVNQTEQMPSMMTADTVSKIGEANVGMEEKAVFESSDTIPSNRYVDAEGQPKYLYVDTEGRLHTMEYQYVDVKPLFNGKDGVEEWNKYVAENNKFEEIAVKNNLQRVRVSYEMTIDTDGSIIDAKIREGSNQLLGNEVLRLIKTANEYGKWTPGKHEGEILKVRITSLNSTFVFSSN